MITGASSGIGATLSRQLAAQGTKVILSARRESELDALANDIRTAGGDALVRVMDVRDADASVEIVRAVDEEVGGLDLVIANAGVGEKSRKPPTWEAVRAMCHVNFTGAIATLTAVLPRMLERRRGHLVGISSLAGLAPMPVSAVYSATKAGLTMFIDSLRLDLEGTGVTATAVHPGYVRTPLTDANEFPMPFMVEVEDAARLILTRLPAGPAHIDFPLPTATVVRLAGALPGNLVQRAFVAISRRK